MHVKKVSHVKTINLVVNNPGEDEDWLFDIAMDMEPEDGVIWVYGIGDDGVLAFTDFGIESLIILINMYKDDPSLLKRNASELSSTAAYAGCIRLRLRCDIFIHGFEARRSTI